MIDYLISRAAALTLIRAYASADGVEAAEAHLATIPAAQVQAKDAEIARMTAERDAVLAGAVKVKPLVWEGVKSDVAHALGYTYYIAHDFDGWRWLRIVGEELDDVAEMPVPTIEAAKSAAQADYEARVCAALQPDPDARQADLAKAWTMGRDAAAGAAKHAGLAFGYERAVQAILALTPPADLAAKIGGAE